VSLTVIINEFPSFEILFTCTYGRLRRLHDKVLFCPIHPQNAKQKCSVCRFPGFICLSIKIKKRMKHWRKHTDRGKPNYFKTNISNCHSVNHKSHVRPLWQQDIDQPLELWHSLSKTDSWIIYKNSAVPHEEHSTCQWKTNQLMVSW